MTLFGLIKCERVWWRDPAANSEDFQVGRGDHDSPVTEEELSPPRQMGPRTSVAPDEFSIFI